MSAHCGACANATSRGAVLRALSPCAPAGVVRTAAATPRTVSARARARAGAVRRAMCPSALFRWEKEELVARVTVVATATDMEYAAPSLPPSGLVRRPRACATRAGLMRRAGACVLLSFFLSFFFALKLLPLVCRIALRLKSHPCTAVLSPILSPSFSLYFSFSQPTTLSARMQWPRNVQLRHVSVRLWMERQRMQCSALLSHS